jgi:hypothetical protein
LAFASWGLFGPVWGFHHSYGFGIFAYMGWDRDGDETKLPAILETFLAWTTR